MDNLSVHRSKKVRELMDQLQIEQIFNVAYSPEYNPIELCFTSVKARFKQLKTNDIINQTKAKTLTLIKESFNRLTKDTVKAHI